LIPLVLTDRDKFDKKEMILSNEGDKLALKISFGLKSSQYATMALRELIRDEDEILNDE
jgi:tRNA(Glu) U13 pseudouridine synthase TruD